MNLEHFTSRREKLAEEFQKALEQRDRLRQAHEEAGQVVERIRGAMVLCDEFIQAARAIAMPVPPPGQLPPGHSVVEIPRGNGPTSEAP